MVFSYDHDETIKNVYILHYGRFVIEPFSLKIPFFRRIVELPWQQNNNSWNELITFINIIL